MGNPFPAHHILKETLGLFLANYPRKKHRTLPCTAQRDVGLEVGKNSLLQAVFRLCGIHHNKSFGVFLCQIHIPVPNSFVKNRFFLLKPVLSHHFTLCVSFQCSLYPHTHGAIEQKSNIRRNAKGGNLIQVGRHMEVLSTGIPLVCGGRIKKAVAQNPFFLRQGRFDNTCHMQDPVRLVKEQFGQGGEIPVLGRQQDLPDIMPDGRTTRLPRLD